MVVLVVKVVKVVIRLGFTGSGRVIRVFWHGLVTAMGDMPKMVPTLAHTLNAHILTAGSHRSLQRGLHTIHI